MSYQYKSDVPLDSAMQIAAPTRMATFDSAALAAMCGGFHECEGASYAGPVSSISSSLHACGRTFLGMPSLAGTRNTNVNQCGDPECKALVSSLYITLNLVVVVANRRFGAL